MTSISKQKASVDTTKPGQVVDLDALMRANMERVFNERNVQRRLAALGELYADDAILYDPEAVVTGREAISMAVESLLGHFPPDFVFNAAGPAVGHHGGAAFLATGPARRSRGGHRYGRRPYRTRTHQAAVRVRRSSGAVSQGHS
jgi:hypothetical protein